MNFLKAYKYIRQKHCYPIIYEFIVAPCLKVLGSSGIQN